MKLIPINMLTHDKFSFVFKLITNVKISSAKKSIHSKYKFQSLPLSKIKDISLNSNLIQLRFVFANLPNFIKTFFEFSLFKYVLKSMKQILCVKHL